MKRVKRLLGLGITVCMLTSLVPQAAFADHIDFDGRAQIKATDCTTGGWGTIQLEEDKILSANNNTDLTKLSASKSVFNQFVYNRGKNYYTYASDNTKFVYDTKQSDYGAKISDGKYLYAVYDEGNNKGIYKVDFAARFSSDLRKLIEKGDLEVAIVAEANNYNGKTNKQRGIANLRFYSNKSDIQSEITTATDNYSGTRTVTAGWHKPNTDITRVMMNLRSERNKFTRNFNKSWVSKVRVFLRDTGAPGVSSCSISGGNFTSRKNVNGKSVYTAKVGSKIEYAVQFDEKIKVSDQSKLSADKKLKLLLKSNIESNTSAANFTADFDRVVGDKVYFTYTVPDNTENKYELKVTADSAKLLNAESCITDIAGNALEKSNTSFAVRTSGTVHTVDDTYTRLTSDALDTESRKPYSATSVLKNENIVYGALPKDVYNNTKQSTIFSESSTKKPVFRMVLDDEIQKDYLNGNTKLKLQVYDRSGNAVQNEYVYAKLICAGIVGVNKNSSTNGIKSDARTELYFEYTPQKINGYPIYKLNLAGEEKSGIYTLDENIITCGTKKIRNISDMEVNGKNIKINLNGQYRTLPPFNMSITIDTEEPALSEKNLSNIWSKTFDADASLVFTDNGGFGTDGAKVALVHYDSSGKRNILPIQANSRIATNEVSLMPNYVNGSKNEISIKLSDLKLSDAYKAQYPLYLEYTVSDLAGNKKTNVGQKNIEVHLDNTAPTVSGVTLNNEKGNVTVKYDVADTGVGKISPMIEYVLHNYSENTVKERSHEDTTQAITVTGNQGRLDHWQVEARFSDTVGNKMSSPAKSGVFTTALRGMTLDFNDSADSVVAENHHITADVSKLPAEEATFTVKYGWKRGSSATVSSDAKTEVNFASAAELAAYDFAADEIQKKYNSGSLFDGEFTLAIETVMMPEDSKQIHTQPFYFDRKAPEGVIAVNKDRSGVNQAYEVTYDLYDDASEYKDGAYVDRRNIDFSSGNEPVMKLYIDDELAKAYQLSTFKSSQTIDFKAEFGSDEKYENASSARAEIVFKDNFGHSSTITGEEMVVDLKAPTIDSIYVDSESLLERGEDLYVVNSLNDIKSITAFISDDAGDLLNVKCGARNTEKQTADYTVTVDKLVNSDFQYRYDEYSCYDYTFNVTDMGGNSVSRTVTFAVDWYAPYMYYTDLAPITNKTNAESVELELDYYIDDYETNDDIEISVSGPAEIADRSEAGKLTLKVKNNGTVKVTTRDRMGKTGEKTFEVNCFDRTAPVIKMNTKEQKSESGPAKYGTITMTASDNETLNVLGVAIMPGDAVPSDSDYFTDYAETRATSVNDDGETDETPSEEGYFGEYSGDAFAKLTSVNPIGATGNVSAGYKLSYGAIPDGTYSVYARVSDEVGNVTQEKLTVINTTSDTASVSTEYTPDGGENGEIKTGGNVTARVTTDIRTRLLYGESDNNMEAMKAHAEEMRANGYTYTYKNVTKTLSFEEACAEYRRIAQKYILDEGNLTDEEKYLVKYIPTSDNYERYSGYLENDLYIDPEGDLPDYLLNQCLYGTDYSYAGEYYTPYFDVDTSSGTTVSVKGFTDTEYDEVISTIMSSGILYMIYKNDAAGDDSPVGEDIAYSIDLGSYPVEFDEYSISSIDKEQLIPSDEADADSFENPFYGKSTVTPEELYEVFGTDFDLSLVTEASEGRYENPLGEFAEEWSLTAEQVNETLRGYMTEYIEDRTKYYNNPFIGEGILTYAEIRQALAAVPRLQSIREETVEKAADKYVRSYVSMSGNVFATEHIMTFSDNVANRIYSLVDEAGRASELTIDIDWIDHTKPYVPKENVKLYIGGDEFDGKYTNAESGTLEVVLPTEGIFAEYRLANLPAGAVGTEVGTTTDGVTLYSGFTLEVTENGTVAFDVLNPTSSETEMSPQTYVVKCFDRDAPTYELIYSPQKPSNGADVNTDVTVSLAEIEDDYSGYDGITVSESSHTFTENGKYTFTLTDEAGNTATVPVTVDYIDKTPTELSVKFKSGEAELDTDESFTFISDEADYRSVSYTYDYKGGYLKDDVTALVYFRGDLIQSINIGDDGEHKYTYTRSNGSRGTVIINGIKFDKQPPEAEITYTYIAAAAGEKDAVKADVTLTDNISPTVSIISVSGSDDAGKVFTEADVKANADGTRSIIFNNNGNVSLVFKDTAGNTTETTLSVTELDRTLPRAFISYSSETETNSDVIANISLSKLADYRVYGDNNVLLKDYSGAFSTYITYAFEENGTRVFQFRDTSGNETEGLLATVNNIDKEKPRLSAVIEYNKMVTDEDKLEYYPGAATIILSAESAGDVLTGGSGDTILLQNAVQSQYHSVLSNGRYAFRYMDKAGNFDVLYVDVDGIDTTLPTAETIGNPTEWTNVPPEITVKAKPKASGIKSYIYQNGVKQEQTTLTPAENGIYTYTVTDEIGNSSTHEVEVKYVDTVYPEITVNTDNVYSGNYDIYIKAGEFDKAAFEDVSVYDGESGTASAKPDIEYGSFDQNVPGEYPVYFKISDIAGNETVLTRRILVMGPDDIYAAINKQLIVPGSQVNYWLGEELTLSFVNAEASGNKVSYAFEKGYYNGAQLKGKSFKALADPTDEITLEAEEAGMYTLFLQTENRNVMVMYVFISG